MEKMLDGIKLVKVMCVDPNGVWAMVRIAGFPHSMPYVVRVKELSQPTKREPDAVKSRARKVGSPSRKGSKA